MIRGLGGRAAAISATRLMNYGLVLISPVILTRLLTVEDFGRYREFLVYVTLLGGISAFGINSSLLRFVPDNPRAAWRFVSQAALMTLASSMLVTGSMLTLNALFDGKLLEGYAVPVALYVLFFVNMDFWEFLWLAEKRSWAVLRYTTARLVVRILVVIGAAALTRDVMTIIWSLVCVEALRLMISIICWRVRVRTVDTTEPPRWREHLLYCLPFGGAMALVILNKSIGPLLVGKLIGPAALAHYTIGVYLQPVIYVLRNSLSDVVLPEMTSQASASPTDRLKLWRRSTVVAAIFLCAAAVFLARFADVLVVTLFSESYQPAVVIFQIYLFVFLREVVDFGLPLRAISHNAPILHAGLISVVVGAVLMITLMPLWGLVGAVVALVIARFAEGSFLASRTARAYGIPLRLLAPWKELLKILAAASLSAVVLYGRFWTERLGILGPLLGGAIYISAFAMLLLLLRIPEASLLLGKLREVAVIIQRQFNKVSN